MLQTIFSITIHVYGFFFSFFCAFSQLGSFPRPIRYGQKILATTIAPPALKINNKNLYKLYTCTYEFAIPQTSSNQTKNVYDRCITSSRLSFYYINCITIQRSKNILIRLFFFFFLNNINLCNLKPDKHCPIPHDIITT